MFWILPALTLGSSLLADDGEPADVESGGRTYASRRHPFHFIGACPVMTREFVNYVTDNSKDVTYTTLARYCDLDELREQNHPAMWRISNTYGVSFHKGKLPSGTPCYYFVWSAMEHFFVEEPKAFDLGKETEIAHAKGWT
jgi:hypothetical protein